MKINNILTVNGIRFSLEDGSWGLIRASSNKPSLVVVTESPTSDELKKEIFYFIDKSFRKLITCERLRIELVPITLPAGKSIKFFPELLINASFGLCLCVQQIISRSG